MKNTKEKKEQNSEKKKMIMIERKNQRNLLALRNEYTLIRTE